MSKWTTVAGLAVAAAAAAAPVQELWNARFNGLADREDLVFAMTVDAAGRVIVTGSSDNNVNPDPFATVKYDTNGVQQWVARYTGPRQIDSPAAIAVDGQGYIYVTGFSHGTASNYDPDYTTIKYAPEGTELWVARYNGAGTNANNTADNPVGVVVNSFGDVYVTGTSAGSTGTLDIATIKYDSAGTELWVARFNGPDARSDYARGLGIDGNGNIYVAGISQRNDARYDVVLLKYSPGGALLWSSSFGTPVIGTEPQVALKVDASGNAHLAWSTYLVSSPIRVNVVKYDTDGNRLWNATHRTVREDVAVWVVGIDLDDDGNACVLAGTSLFGNSDYLVVKFSAAGDELWSSRFNSQWQSQDTPKSIAIDGAGNIYATGLSYTGGNSYQFATVKFRPNGHRAWVALTSLSDNFGQSEAIVRVDDAGHVYVSGSAGQVGDKDYYTVKYRQLPQPNAPQIVAGPVPQMVAGGGNATFSVTATGEEPLTYQWRHEGIAIPGATGRTLSLSNITYEARGYYSVEVSNSAGSVSSPQALLVVVIPPIVWNHPVSQSAIIGGPAEFSVTAGGTEPLAYQWHHNGSPLTGQTNASLLISNVQPASAGSYFVVVSNAGGGTNSETVRLSLLAGVEQCFGSSFHGPGESYAFPQRLRLDPEGKPHVGQTIYHPNGRSEFVTIQFDTNGAVVWVARYAVGTNPVNVLYALALDAAGNVYVAGNTGNYQATENVVVKYGPAGNQLWAATYGGNQGYASVVDMAVDAGGNIYVTGSVYDQESPQDFLTVKLNTAGQQQWLRRYSVSAGSTDVPGDIEVGADGTVYVFGTSIESSFHHVLLKYDAEGNVLWERRQHAGNEATAAAMLIDAAGDLIMTGTGADATGNSDFVTMKYNPAGDLLWVTRYRSFLNGFDRPYALALDGFGNVYVAGSSSLPGEEYTDVSAFATAKYDPNGNELWVASRLDRAGAGGPDSLAVDAAGNSYVTFGRYAPGSGMNFHTLKYDSEGTRVWSADSTTIGYNDEYPSSLRLSPDGGILVAGVAQYPLDEVLLFKLKDRDTPGAPVITQSPQSQQVTLGATVTFSVTATGQEPLSYQWFFNGSEIFGATGTNFAISTTILPNLGHYSVQVSNAVGTVLSRSGVLDIRVPPAIVQQPQSQSILVGSDVLLSVLATGSDPLRYQWRFNGTNIPGAHSPSLAIGSAQLEHSGIYSVTVSNAAGAINSAGAIVSVSRQGRREWLTLFDGGTNGGLFVEDMEIGPDGAVYLTGYSQTATRDYFTAKFNTNGAQLWSARFGTPFGNDYAAALALDFQGNVYVTGHFETDGLPAIGTVKYDSAGNELWVRQFQSTGGASGTDIVVGPSGHVYVTGASGAPGEGFTTIKYTADGDQLWSAYYSGPAPYGHTPRHIAVDAAGNVFVSGDSRGDDTGVDVATVKYDPNGNRLWAVRFAESGYETSADLKLDPAGNVLVAVHGAGDMVLIKYTSAGQQDWLARYDSGRFNEDRLAAIDIDAAGNAYATGFSLIDYYFEDGEYQTDYDIVTLKISSAGHVNWVSRYIGADARIDSGLDIALDGSGGLYVTGWTSSRLTAEDMIVLRYDTNGVRYWRDIYSSTLTHFERGRLVRSAGPNSIYAAGTATDAGGLEDLILIKYSHQDAPGVPAIVTTPQSQVAVAGNPVTFSVVATGDAPLQYQWRFNGIAVPGAVGATFTVPNVQMTNAGGYSVDVGNGAGLVASPEARLTVRVPATIVRAPEDQCIVAGSHAVFRVSFVGDQEVTIRWHRDGFPLDNNSSSLSISNAQAVDAGLYSVTVSNQWGAMTASARLIITPRAALAWNTIFNSTNSSHEQPNAGTTDAAGNVYITGFGGNGIETVKFNSDGSVAWNRSYTGTNGGSAAAYGIAVDASGAVYVTGSARGINNYDVVTIKYDANGNQLWLAEHDAGEGDSGIDIEVDSAGNVYVAGTSGYEWSTSDFLTLKYDSGGNRLWASYLAGPAGSADVPTDLAIDDTGNVYVTGYTTESIAIEYYPIADYMTVKYDSNGNELWVAQHAGPAGADDRASAIAVDDAGNVYVTGRHSHNYSINSGTTVYFDYDYATLKYNSQGQRLWLAVYAGPRPDPDEATDLVLDPFGNVIVTGRSEHDIVTIKYTGDGEQLWVSRIDTGLSYDAPRELVADAAGNIYVTGQSGNDVDILTFKLDPNGTREWFARYSGPGGAYTSYDYPVGLGLDAAGNVLVAGSSHSVATARDYLALKYTINSPAGVPIITLPPLSQSVLAGTTATFTVAAAGAAPFGYQWRRNGVTMNGQTNPTLTIPAVTFDDVARYSVVVFNALDCVTSADATLAVLVPEDVQCAGIERMPGGSIRLIIAGPAARNYRVEATANLANWQTIATVYNYTGVCEYTDSDAGQYGRRFYRVVSE